jgi:hypothetical protein
MCVGSRTAGTLSSSLSRPDNEFETDRLYLETTKQKEKTAIRVGETATQRRESRRLAEDRHHQLACAVFMAVARRSIHP